MTQFSTHSFDDCTDRGLFAATVGAEIVISAPPMMDFSLCMIVESWCKMTAPERCPPTFEFWCFTDMKCWIVVLIDLSWLYSIGKSLNMVSSKLSVLLKKLPAEETVKHQKHKAASTSPESLNSSHSALRSWLGSHWVPMAPMHEISRGLEPCWHWCSMEDSESVPAILPLSPSSSSVSPWGEAQQTQCRNEDNKTEQWNN